MTTIAATGMGGSGRPRKIVTTYVIDGRSPQEAAGTRHGLAGRPCSVETLREEDMLAAGSIGCVSDFGDGVPMLGERCLELLALAKPQCRV